MLRYACVVMPIPYSRQSPHLALRPILALAGCALFTTPYIANAQGAWNPDQTLPASSGGSGIWDTTSEFWLVGGSNVAWGNSGAATFGGTTPTGTVTISNGGAGVSATGLTFNTGSNYTIQGEALTFTTSPRTISTGGTAIATISSTLNATGITKSGTGTLYLTGGTVGTPSPLGTGDNLFATGTTYISGYLNASGKTSVTTGATVNWSGVGTFSTTNYFGVTSVGSSSALNVTGGSLTMSGAGAALFVGSGGSVSSTLHVSGGSLAVTQSSRAVRIGTGYEGNGANGGGELRISGTGLFTTEATTGIFQLGSNMVGTTTNPAGAGVVNLDGGTLETNRAITKGSSSNATGTFNFNGGTLRAAGTSMTLNGLTRANVRDGGAVIDTNTFDVTISQALVHSDIDGDDVIDGGLTKNGEGALTLSGVNTYTGDTTINNGTFTLAEATGALTFYIGADGVNNSVGGTGTANFDGIFIFDLSGAGATAGDSWSIVDVSTLSESFSGTFVVQDFTETFVGSGVWTLNDYSFIEATGVLTYAAIPEPSTYAMLVGVAGLGIAGARRHHRRRSA